MSNENLIETFMEVLSKSERILFYEQGERHFAIVHTKKGVPIRRSRNDLYDLLRALGELKLS